MLFLSRVNNKKAAFGSEFHQDSVGAGQNKPSTSDQTKSNAHGVFPDQNCRVWDLVPAHNSMIRGHFGLGMV